MADIEKKDLENETADAPAENGAKKEKTKSDALSKSKKSDKPSIPSRIAAWFRSCKAEMNKVVWSSPKTVVNNSITVIVTVVVVALCIALLDYLFSAGIVGLNRII